MTMRSGRTGVTSRIVFVAATTMVMAFPKPVCADGATPTKAVPAPNDADAIDRAATDAYDEGKYAFCTNPRRPLGSRQRGLCAFADRVDHCEGYAKACRIGEVPEDYGWLARVVKWAAPVARLMLYLVVLGIVVAVAIPVVRALMKLRRNHAKKKRIPDAAPNRGTVTEEVRAAPVEETADAETVFRLAEEHRARGELASALGLYLRASLLALERRGAIRVARHRTNGDYVRACDEETSRPSLRDIVREVDKVEFGGVPPTKDALALVASRALSVVTKTALSLVVAALALGSSACGTAQSGSDPAENELPIEVLRRNGFELAPLANSLSTMPIPEDGVRAPAVIVDVERVQLGEETQAHLMRWVAAGGVLILLGNVGGWPNELGARTTEARTNELVVRAPSPRQEPDDDDEDSDDRAPYSKPPQSKISPVEITGGRTARMDAFDWRESDGVEDVAFVGQFTYASKKYVGEGIVLGIANDDLFTNVGVRPRRNAAALVTLVRFATHDPQRRLPISNGNGSPRARIQVARAEDGVPPPDNPFAALAAAGLGKGAWHALVAAIVLFLAYGIRHARARPFARKPRRAFVEHVEAVGAFYERTRASAHALAAYGRFVELHLREMLPRGADPVTFLVAATGTPIEHAAEIYKRATEAKADDAPRGDELAIIEELRQWMALLTTDGRLRASDTRGSRRLTKVEGRGRS